MAETSTTARRRGQGEDSIYLDAARNRYVGAVSLGFGPDNKHIRRKVSGKTKQEVRDKLKAMHADLDAGLRTSATYTVAHAVEDWLSDGSATDWTAARPARGSSMRDYCVPLSSTSARGACGR